MLKSHWPSSIPHFQLRLPLSLLAGLFIAITLTLPLSLYLSHSGSMGRRVSEGALFLPGLTVAQSPTTSALVVTSVQSDGPDARSSITVGDQIARINGRPVFTLKQARFYLADHHDHAIWLEVVHGTVRHSVHLYSNP